MMRRTAPVRGELPAEVAGFRPRVAHLIRIAMETVTLTIVCAAPWFYGSVPPGFRLLLLIGIGLLLVLWAFRMLVEGRLTWVKCPVALCLAGLFLIGVWQITLLSRSDLARVSPGTSRLYDRLLPAQTEVLGGADQEERPLAPAGATISLYPTATRLELVRLLAVFLLFAAVRNNIASEAGLRRLSVAVLVNGAALSLFALVQHFSSSPDTVFWSYPSLGQVFGPFICRNHFPFYVNVCIGLGVGLILNRASHLRKRGHQLEGGDSPSNSQSGGSVFRWQTVARHYLHDPATLWICAVLVLMLVAVSFALSRGGYLALASGAFVCLLLRWSQSLRSARGETVLLVAALAVLLAGWLGVGLIQERLSTLWKGEALQSRLPAWSRTVTLVKDFPIWGTGYGTFQYVEPVTRRSDDGRVVWEHAHNDYLEMLIEAGVPGLLLTLLVVGLLFRFGYRTVRGGGRAAPLHWEGCSVSPPWWSIVSGTSGCTSRRSLSWPLSSPPTCQA